MKLTLLSNQGLRGAVALVMILAGQGAAKACVRVPIADRKSGRQEQEL